MIYSVKEMFYSLQGEGARAGRPAVFVLFAGCNLWNGLERDRDDAICKFCDTQFVGVDGQDGGEYVSAVALAEAAAKLWPGGGRPYVVCTGGEPLLQLDPPLIEALHKAGFEVAIETNGTIKAPAGIDWICVSPKAGAPLKQNEGDELKLVFPQQGIEPASLEHLRFDHFFIQPMAGATLAFSTRKAIGHCLANPVWRLSLQTKKFLALR
jgi:7-carboxy-7-deazaguanine synthase (Cx14CxxC type)